MAVIMRRWILILFCLLGVATVAPAQSSAPVATATSIATAAPAYHLPADKLHKAVVLGRIRAALAIAEGLWDLGFLWLFLARGWAARLSGWSERRVKPRWLSGLLFFAVFLFLSTLAGLPLSILGHMAGLHYGISVQGWGGWWTDEAKSLGLSLLLLAPLMLLFHALVRRFRRFYWLGLWAVTVPLMLATVFVEPLVIAPLFNHFEPLSAHHAELVPKLERLVARTGTQIPPERMFLMRASTKSNGINAYVTGIGASKRFVLWDTATDRIPDDEILFIFGHESGHYVLHHIPKLIAGSLLGLLVAFALSAGLTHRLATARAGSWHLLSEEQHAPEAQESIEKENKKEEKNLLAERPGFLVLLLVLSAVSFLAAPINNAFSRHYEHEADVYGQEALHGLVADPQQSAVAAFNDLGSSWLEDPAPNPVVEFWLFSHPSVSQRASFAAHYDPWTSAGRGRFFH